MGRLVVSVQRVVAIVVLLVPGVLSLPLGAGIGLVPSFILLSGIDGA